MPRLTIDGQSVDAASGTSVLAAAAQLGIAIPTLCHLDGIEPLATCMVCLVEERKSGRLIPSCAARAEDGMCVETSSDLAVQARRTALELLLSEHAGECIAPCERACPLGIDIPDLLDRVEIGDLAGAWRLLRQRVALPETAVRLCGSACEKACRRREVDGRVRIGTVHAEIAAWGARQARSLMGDRRPATGKRVAIVGAGLAGLAAADVVIALGHACTLYDEEATVGVRLRASCAAAGLDEETLDREIGAVLGRGADLRLGARVGAGVSWRQARRECDVLLLAMRDVPERAEALGVTPVEGPLGAEGGGYTSTVAPVLGVGAGAAHGREQVLALAAGRDLGWAAHRLLVREPHAPVGRRTCSQLRGITPDELATMLANRRARSRSRTIRRSEASEQHIETAREEAQRCLGCGCRSTATCRLRRLCQEQGVEARRYPGVRRTVEAVQEHALVRFEGGKCILCGRCAQLAELAGEPLGLATVGRGFASRVRVPLGRPFAETLERSAVACAAVCPTGALTLREAEKGGGA